MPKYLIDINLPYYFSIWNNDDYIHQRDIDPKASDSVIWQYAKNQNLTIITKDRDYADRILWATPPPRIIHLKVGNLKLRDFHVFVSKCWGEVLEISQTHKLVFVFKDSIEGIE
jgi:predicted nuclease of predicted toxin-antitoxin system